MGVFSRRKSTRQEKVARTNQTNDLTAVGSDDSWIRLAMPLLWPAAWSIVFLSIIVNAQNADSWQALWLGVVFDILGPVAIAMMARARVERMWTICFVFAACSVVWSLVNALNTGAHGTFGAERSAAHAAKVQADLVADTAAAETELGKVSSARPTVAIEGEIAAILDDPRSGRCEEINGPFTKTECPKVTALRRELGTAKARDTAAAKLAELKARLKAPVATVEPYVELVQRIGRRAGVEVEGDTVRLAKTILFVFLLEFGKTFAIGFVAWVTPRSSSPTTVTELRAGSPPEAPGRTIEVEEAPGPISAPIVRPDPVSWLLAAFSGDGPLPEGLERQDGGVYGPYKAFAAAWGTSEATANRLGKRWGAEGRFAVASTVKGTLIAPNRRLRRVV